MTLFRGTDYLILEEAEVIPLFIRLFEPDHPVARQTSGHTCQQRPIRGIIG